MYAKTAYHMHADKFGIRYTPKSIFVYQYLEFSFLFGVLFTHFHETGLTKSHHFFDAHGGIYSENVFPS